MKVLLNQHIPVSLLSEKERCEIQELKQALEGSGVDVEFLDWWREDQSGDVLHQLGPIRASVIKLAHLKGWRVVMTVRADKASICGGGSNFVVWMLSRMPLPKSVRERLPWNIFSLVDRLIVASETEKQAIVRTLCINPGNISIVIEGDGLVGQMRALYETVLKPVRK